MYILTILLSIACIILVIALARLCADIRSLCRQLEEIERGSHMELTALTRQNSLLQLCRYLNRILAARDQNHIQYERAEKQLKQNITNLAHDIRTPLTGASGYLQLARECDDAGKRDHYLSVAGRRLEELADMLEKLFLYTKLANEDFTFSDENRKQIQVLPLLSDCLLGFYTKFEEQNIEPEVRFESDGFRVLADEDALRRIFLNLLQNALIHGAGNLVITQQVIYNTQSTQKGNPCPKATSDKIMPRDKASDKSIPRDKASDKSIPRDKAPDKSMPWDEAPDKSMPWDKASGKSMPWETGIRGCLIFENSVSENSVPDPEQIFDLFYKADTARRKASSGLGLFIVKELMKRMGGDASAELEGSTLRIFLYFPFCA